MSRPPTSEPERKIRVLIAKVGLDGHDRGAKLVARALMDSGLEVIYLGLRQTVDQAVAAAVQEGVDVVGLSFLAGDQMTLIPKFMNRLREAGGGNILVVAGGIILPGQIPAIREMGVGRVFLPGTPPAEIVEYIKQNA